MITEELLSEVLNTSEPYFESSNGKELVFWSGGFYRKDRETERINIYELAHKCKEWARTQDYYIQTGNRLDGTTRYDVLSARIDIDFEDYDDSEIFSEIYDTEPEAIFKACEWILEQKSKSWIQNQ